VFTGIIEEQGELVDLIMLEGEAARVAVRGPIATSDAVPGCSIAVDGVCLTVVELSDGVFTADVMRETLIHTTIGSRVVGDRVNLERSVPAGGRLGGHIVSGHVDSVATIAARTPAPHWEVVRVAIPCQLARQIAKKGSVAVDGVSLTVTAVSATGEDPAWFEVSLIPSTLAATTLGSRPVGDQVNIETDVLAKYVERLIEGDQR